MKMKYTENPIWAFLELALIPQILSIALVEEKKKGFVALLMLSELDLEVIMFCLRVHQLGGVTGGRAFVILFVHQDLGHYNS